VDRPLHSDHGRGLTLAEAAPRFLGRVSTLRGGSSTSSSSTSMGAGPGSSFSTGGGAGVMLLRPLDRRAGCLPLLAGGVFFFAGDWIDDKGGSISGFYGAGMRVLRGMRDGCRWRGAYLIIELLRALGGHLGHAAGRLLLGRREGPSFALPRIGFLKEGWLVKGGITHMGRWHFRLKDRRTYPGRHGCCRPEDFAALQKLPLPTGYNEHVVIRKPVEAK
jgi:hypothetical protein